MRVLRLLAVLAASAVVGAVVAVTTRPGEVACGVMLPREYHGPAVTCPRLGVRGGLVVLVSFAVAVTGLLILGLTSAGGVGEASDIEVPSSLVNSIQVPFAA